MSQLSMFNGPGFFYVPSQPKPEYLAEYHDWYNSEHGPLRLKLDFFQNGYRYKCIEPAESGIWLACYDLKKISGLDEPRYTILRQKRSDREQELLNSKINWIDRRIYEDISSRGTSSGPAPIIMSVAFVVRDDLVDEVDRWYEEEHISDLQKIPGWIRSRRFKLIEADDQKPGYTEMLAVHDFEKENGLDGKEHHYAKSRPWRNKVVGLVETRVSRKFEFYHEFDASDYKKPESNQVNGYKASATTTTGATSWQIDGSKDPQAPVIVFSNSLLTDLHIWDRTVEELSKLYPQLRFLRYNTRGYDNPPTQQVHVDMLSEDVCMMLDKLGIEKCFAMIGVSLGGTTTLNFAARYPSRIERFIACDCNVVSSEKNTKAWWDRVELTKSEGGWEKLADQTVKRWFAPDAILGQTPGMSSVKDMILAANRPGFESCVAVLCDLDIRESIKQIRVPGACLVGAEDGVLPAAMLEFSKTIPGCTFAEVADAGHLPMVERPEAFLNALLPLLELPASR